MVEGSRAYDVPKRVPFLVPFTSRVKIFTSQLAAAKETSGSHAVFTRNRFRIRRDHILEDAFSQLSTLSEEDLKAAIRVTFVNEFGVEETGIDGGGIFKDFMENIIRSAFDAQYGLFKGSPKQPGGIECGYVVMRYMKEIIEDKEMKLINLWGTKNLKTYTMEVLNVVRFEALDYIQAIM